MVGDWSSGQMVQSHPTNLPTLPADITTAFVSLNQQFPDFDEPLVHSIAQLNRPKMQFALANLQWVRKMTPDHLYFV